MQTACNASVRSAIGQQQARRARAPRAQARFQSVSPPEPGSPVLPRALASQQQQQQRHQQHAQPAPKEQASGSLPASASEDAAASSVEDALQERRTAPAALRVRPAEAGEFWAIADLHACAFYPRSTPFWFAALRLDRVMSIQVGAERQQDDVHFLCLVAEAGHTSADAAGSAASEAGQPAASSSGGAMSADTAVGGGSGEGDAAGGRVVRDFLTPAGARADSVDLGPLVAALVRLAFPPAMRQDYGASYSAGGLCGTVVVDTLGDFVPPKRRRMPNGTVREVRRPGIAYLSNLAVAPCSRRGGIGTLLVREAEQAAAQWGCRSVALHVDPGNTAAVEMYRRAGYRKVADQPQWQRILEGRSKPLALMLRVLPWEQRQRAQRAREAAQQAGREERVVQQAP